MILILVYKERHLGNWSDFIFFVPFEEKKEKIRDISMFILTLSLSLVPEDALREKGVFIQCLDFLFVNLIILLFLLVNKGVNKILI